MSIYLGALLFGFVFSLPLTAHESQITPALEVQEIKTEILSQTTVEAPKAPPIPSILQKIAECESHGSHYDEYGRVLRGEENPNDIGKYQINLNYWGEDAKKYGHDLYTEEGNEAMALEIYKRYGTTPWNWSRGCWGR